jgi:hypothetical protein
MKEQARTDQLAHYYFLATPAPPCCQNMHCCLFVVIIRAEEDLVENGVENISHGCCMIGTFSTQFTAGRSRGK